MKPRRKEGPSWCSLCKGAEKSIVHLFIACPFARRVWLESAIRLGVVCSWDGLYVEEAWQDWCSNRQNANIKTLPLIISWEIWIAMNSVIFKEKVVIPEVVASQGLGILAQFPQEKGMWAVRLVQVELVDKSRPRAFFDGAAQDHHCGGGAVLYLSDQHYFKHKMGLGGSSNNYAELLSLKLLIRFAIEKDVSSLQIYGDSMNVINWTKKTQQCQNLLLLAGLEEVHGVMVSFDSVDLHHVYRERNREANSLSKEGLQLGFGQWMISEYRDPEIFEYYHPTFVDIQVDHKAVPD